MADWRPGTAHNPLFRFFTDHQVPPQVDLAIRDLGFHGDQVFIPFGGNGRRDVMELDIFFRHLLFRQDRAQLHHLPCSGYADL